MNGKPRRPNLRDRVVLCKQNASGAANTDGEIPESEQQVEPRWAEVMPLSGRERFLAEQTKSDITYRVTVRYDDLTKTVTTAWWLKIIAGQDTGRRLNIVRAFDPDRRRRWIEMECRERASA